MEHPRRQHDGCGGHDAELIATLQHDGLALGRALRALLIIPLRRHIFKDADVADGAGRHAVARAHHSPFSFPSPTRGRLDQTNCTAMPPSWPKSACSVSPLRAWTTRVNEPASTKCPGSSATPCWPSLLASQATPIAG